MLLFDKEVEVEPAILLVPVRVQTLHVHGFTDADALVEKDYFFLGGEALQWVRDLHVYLELDDLAELTDHDVVADVETEEEFAEQALVRKDQVV